MLIQVIASFFVTIFFSIIFNNGKKQLFYSGLVGASGWFTYLLLVNNNYTVVMASFFATLVISIIATVLSTLRKAPITVFQIPGIIPIVPGTGMYNTLYGVITNDYEAAIYNLFETLQIAGAIAVAMMLIYTLRTLIMTKKNSVKNH